MNKAVERVKINEQNKVEKTMCFMINTNMQLFWFQGSGIWLCRKWKDCQMCCNCYVYNFKVTAYHDCQI